MDDLMSGLGGQLADRWAAVLFTPAFLFWLGGVLAWTSGDSQERSWSELGHHIGDLTGPEQLLVAATALVVVAASGVLVERLTLPCLRFLEGYWPAAFTGLRRRIVALRSRRIERRLRRRDELTARVEN